MEKKPPGNGADEANMAIEVELLVGVVPVADLKQPLHHSAGDIFQHCGGDHTEEPHQK
jgi:hypothetical protein